MHKTRHIECCLKQIHCLHHICCLVRHQRGLPIFCGQVPLFIGSQKYCTDVFSCVAFSHTAGLQYKVFQLPFIVNIAGGYGNVAFGLSGRPPISSQSHLPSIFLFVIIISENCFRDGAEYHASRFSISSLKAPELTTL